MSEESARPDAQDAARLRKLAQWALLLAVSVALAGLLNWIGAPAALMLGPMFAAILFGFRGARLSISGPAFGLAQGVVGCMIASSLPVSVSADVLARWPLLVFGVLSVMFVAGLLGWGLTRLGVLPGTTVVWGLSPGAASAMVILSDSFGADSRLVAFMQYTRVILVTAAASLIATVIGGAVPHAVDTQLWFPPVDWTALAGTLALAAGGPAIARLAGIPAAGLVLPIFAGIALTHLGWLDIELPHWLLAIAYMLVGWRIGLPFTRPLILHAMKMLPGIVFSAVSLIVVCAGIAALFVVFAGMDPLTAYLATSPGGADTVAIISASSDVDTPFVMAMQMARFILILLFGPMLARFVARRAVAAESAADAGGPE